MTIPSSQRIFIAGNSGTGKSTMAWRRYLSRMPRRIIVDLTGEWTDDSRKVAPELRIDAVAQNVPELSRALRSVQHRGSWTLVLSQDSEAKDVAALVAWLLPVPKLQASPIRMVGGAVLLVDEVDLIAPLGPPPRPVRTLYRRSRHVGLTIVSTTQRPGNVSREVSANSTQAIALRLAEPRDQEYVTRLFQWSPQALADWRRWTREHPHGGYWKDLESGRSLWIAETGQLVHAAAPSDGGGAARAEAERQLKLLP